MKYLCEKKLTVGGTDYHPGEVIPDGAILPERSGKLLKSGYISDFSGAFGQMPSDGSVKLFTQEEVDNMIAIAVETATVEIQQTQNDVQQVVAELKETEPGAYEGIIQIAVKRESSGENEQAMAIPAKAEEIQQVFSIMQMNAEEGAKVIANVTNENVLILLHAADSRKTVKNAAKEQAAKLYSTEGELNESTGGNTVTDTNTKGDDA